MEGRCQTVEFTGRKSWSLYEETNGKAIEKWIGRDESERRQAVGVKVNVLGENNIRQDERKQKEFSAPCCPSQLKAHVTSGDICSETAVCDRILAARVKVPADDVI